MRRRLFLLVLLSAAALGARQSPEARAALERITADSLRGHLSFIASDLLEGRNTPSRGLDLAADYIAAQFRRAGLEPAGDDGYFQTAAWAVAETNPAAFSLTIRPSPARRARIAPITVGAGQVSAQSLAGLDLKGVPLVKVDLQDAATLAALAPAQVAGKGVIIALPRGQNEALNKLRALKPALVVAVDGAGAARGLGPGRLIDPENRPAAQAAPAPAAITVHDPAVVKLYDAAKPGATVGTMTVKLPAPVEKPVKVRNVIGVLRGSDPALKDTYVLLTAHYDHVGVRPGGEGDRIFNGANDDGSGTVSVMEIAAALATLKERPKRTLVFMTFFGEEKGLLGSRYYGRRPVFPIEKTVAHVNLEHVGRTDDSEGAQVSSASMTGFDFSDVGEVFKAAGEATGIRVYKHERNSDAFFSRSDNQALADQGVPAHTICTAFLFPDYHAVGDHWEKVDYENMARVDRMIALGVLMIAESAEAPKWNAANPKAARYLEAWKARRGQTN